jgi:hypothetical protein
MMAPYRGIYIVRTELPDAETLARWKCEAIRLGVASRAVILRLCWARWYWRVVQGCGPERRTG